jgi:hypothetical protein
LPDCEAVIVTLPRAIIVAVEPLMEQRDNAEVELFTIINEIDALQERAENLRREIAEIDGEMSF